MVLLSPSVQILGQYLKADHDLLPHHLFHITIHGRKLKLKQSPAAHYKGPGLIPSKFMWDMW